MADDPREPRDAPDGGGSGSGPDDDAAVEPEHTRQVDRSAGQDPGPAGGDRPTAPLPGRDATAPSPSRPPSWSGRAGVPPGGPGAVRDSAPVDWTYGDDQDDRRWWMPILLGVIALILLAVLGFAGWLIVESTERGRPGPPPPTATSASTATSQPTSAAATTGTPTPSATTVGTVRVPPLVGLPQEVARGLLDQLGLVPRIRFQTSDQPAGTVLEADPRAGTRIAPGDEVTLVIAEARTPPPTTAAPTTPTQPVPTR